jgi:hypothetical protein
MRMPLQTKEWIAVSSQDIHARFSAASSTINKLNGMHPCEALR